MSRRELNRECRERDERRLNTEYRIADICGEIIGEEGARKLVKEIIADLLMRQSERYRVMAAAIKAK